MLRRGDVDGKKEVADSVVCGDRLTRKLKARADPPIFLPNENMKASQRGKARAVA